MDRPTSVASGVDWFPARTPTLPPATHTNSYALGERQLLLIEPATPFEDERRAWLAWARALASAGRELVAILVTHHHVDHVGGAAFFAEQLQLPLWAHAETAERIEAPVARELSDGEEIVLDGPSVQRWRCLHTPGHAPGHLCLLEDSGVAVVGDMVASEGTILIAPQDGDLAVYLQQLERLEASQASLALPAHGAPIDDPSRLFRHYIDHRLGREAKVLAALEGAGPDGASIDVLLGSAYDDAPKAIWPIARLSLESHLIKLAADGRAGSSDDKWHLSREA